MFVGGLNRVLAATVLPLYLVAGSYCSLGELAGGCPGLARAHGACVASATPTEVDHHSDGHRDHHAAPEPSNHERGDPSQGAPCCESVANALMPSAAARVLPPLPPTHHVMTAAIAETPVLMDLGVIVTLGGLPPPPRAGPAPRGRAPPPV